MGWRIVGLQEPRLPALPSTDLAIRKLRLAAEIERLGLSANASQIEYRDAKTPGLSLILGKRAKTWSLTYAAPAGRRRVAIGCYPQVPLADARREAEAKRVAARGGADHQAAKRQHRAARTVGEIGEEYLEREAKQFATYRMYKGVMRRRVFPAIGKMKLVDVRRPDLNPIIDSPLDLGKFAMANRVFSTLTGFFQWAVARGELTEDPCTGMKRPAKERARERILSDGEIKRVWCALPVVSVQATAAIKLLLLTGQRLNEVVGAKWSEIDFERAVWTLPANEPGRSKKRKAPHLVPLPPAALAIFHDMHARNSALATVFRAKGKKGQPVPPTRNLVSGAKAQLDAVLPDLAPWRTHDLRRTCRTGMGMLGVPVHVAELVIGHALTGIVAIYDRYTYLAEKRSALTRWEAHVLQTVGEATTATAEIVALRA
jgi:integrase